MLKKNIKRHKKIRAGCIIHCDKQYFLLVENYGQRWGFPKGTRDDNESYIECALRETEEETGLVFTKEDTKEFIDILDSRFYIIEVNDFKRVNYPFEIDGEITGINWVSLEKMCDLDLNRHPKNNYFWDWVNGKLRPQLFHIP